MLGSAAVLAHQGGWDEALMVVVPLGLFGGLFWAAFLLWFIAAFFLRGKDLSAFDRPEGQRFSSGAQPSAAHRRCTHARGATP